MPIGNIETGDSFGVPFATSCFLELTTISQQRIHTGFCGSSESEIEVERTVFYLIRYDPR